MVCTMGAGVDADTTKVQHNFHNESECWSPLMKIQTTKDDDKSRHSEEAWQNKPLNDGSVGKVILEWRLRKKNNSIANDSIVSKTAIESDAT